jgi:hypothetical protein
MFTLDFIEKVENKTLFKGISKLGDYFNTLSDEEIEKLAGFLNVYIEFNNSESSITEDDRKLICEDNSFELEDVILLMNYIIEMEQNEAVVCSDDEFAEYVKNFAVAAILEHMVRRGMLTCSGEVSLLDGNTALFRKVE